MRRSKVILLPLLFCALLLPRASPLHAQTSDPEGDGEWGAVLTNWPLQAIHAVLLKKGLRQDCG